MSVPFTHRISSGAFAFLAAAAAYDIIRGRPASANRWGMAAAATLLAPTLIPNCPWWGPVVTRFSSAARTVWLTIDDGPDPADTPGILDVLDRHGATATFFCIGNKVDQYPELARAIVANGHEIGNHTWSHNAFRFWMATPSIAMREVVDCSQSIFLATGTAPSLFRAPAGLANGWVHHAVRHAGLKMIGWSARGCDGVPHKQEEVVYRIAASLQPGAIVLLHEGPIAGMPRGSRCKTLDLVLKEVKKMNLMATKVSLQHLSCPKSL